MGLFGGNADNHLNVEAEKVYTFVDKDKGIIICNKCEGTGGETEYREYYGELRKTGDKKNCRFCDGRGTIKLRLSNGSDK